MRLLSFGIVFLLLIGCDSNDSNEHQQKTDLNNITNLEDEITALANASVCNDETECAYIAFGSKPCGGPWSYLVYSSSIDTELLINKVAEFNAMQNEFNIKYGIVSDCSIVNPPSGLICENDKCKAVYN